jgi:hypothetical protein
MLEELLEGKIRYDADTKRFHRFRIEINSNTFGSLYVAKSADFIPQKIILEADEKPGRSRQVEAVITALNQMGGECDSQADLKAAVMAIMNCSEATSRRAIAEAVRTKQIASSQKFGVGSPHRYRLIMSSSHDTMTQEEEKENV